MRACGRGLALNLRCPYTQAALAQFCRSATVCNLADYGRDYPGAPPPAADHSAHGGSGRYLLKVGIDPPTPERFPQLDRSGGLGSRWCRLRCEQGRPVVPGRRAC